MGIEFEYWSGRDPSQEGKKNFHVYEREKEGKKKRASIAFERASMEVEDDWDLSAEDLDSLERDAFQKIAQLRNPTPSSPHQRHHSATATTNHLPPKPLPDSRPQTAGTLSQAARALPTSFKSGTNNDKQSKELPKFSVKFFLHSSGNVAAKFQYDQVVIAAFRRIPRSSWNAKERLWIFPLSSLLEAEKVLGEIPSYSVQVDNLDPLVKRAVAAASAVPDLQDRYHKIPSYIESKLLPFQREGVRFILQHGGRVLLADEMGLGKTLQAIAVASCIQDLWPVLIIAPSSLRLQWASMIQQWLNIPSSDILIVLSQSGGSNRGGFNIVSSSAKSSIRLDGLFNIISYDLVPKLQNMLMTHDFKVVIADESHFLKNAQAKRTTASLPVIKKAQYALLLSGTPALSRPIELFKQLEALYPDVYRNVHEYGNRYCKGVSHLFITDKTLLISQFFFCCLWMSFHPVIVTWIFQGVFGVYQGASNHEELHNLIKATVMIRRLKKDVLSQLPVKRRQQVFLDLENKDMKQINALFQELEMVKAKIKAAKSQEEAESLKFAQKNLINKIYTDSAEAKIPSVLDYIGTVIEAGCKFLIFAHHQPMIDSIHEFLLKKKVGCIRIDGGTPAASRQQLVTDFQEKDAIKAAVLSIKAGGVGLTLTAASTVIFAELSWTPGDLIQAEDRAHRIGQVSSVNIYYLLANDTVDDIIWDVVQSKLENLGQMLDGHENVLEVSASLPVNSPSKQKTIDQYVRKSDNMGSLVSSPSKQKTLDQFVRRCDNTDRLEYEPNPKRPRS
ncbi:SWI/SNF-related matrix-associated actin-dependent regulator of chromatin subfamily A-like protein 1 isoform X1 [Glycine max]|nr:SWI/SNF-related matrix-associated actin-dependent regulator of chromatin subfamily A-like protein 1 isoform X1 [Glycine max]XP_025982102.1 SWI/SNF-related matrix-associated actin-dependent regulator of chromatin subfamily A-like protein 1 isoform X1 [Glycine max]|eukprot:XP_025982101.1 SWI/SNF-related matrix-associated actin-dependent regulator of chromatin subfamily A-like protein 1 isoform X1 [Glycine max]